MPIGERIGPGIFGAPGTGGGGSGTVTSFTFTNGAGFTGTVTNPTTTPTLSLVYSAATPSTLTLSTITADPAPAVVGTYYRCNYTGNLTLPTSPATGSWVMAKVIGAHTLTIVGTVDGNVNPTAATLVNSWMIYNGTNWDFI